MVLSGSFDLNDYVNPSNSCTNTGNAGEDPFVMRFNGAGVHDVLLAKNWGDSGGAASAEVRSVASAANGDLVMCGRFTGAMTFGLGAIDAPAGSDAFVFRVDSGGASQWVQTWGGSGNDGCDAVAVDAFGQVAVGGTHRSSNVVISGKTLNAPTGSSSGHVAKLSSTGVGLWAFPVNATGAATVGGVGFLSTGDVVYSGAFSGTSDLGNGNVQSSNGGVQVSLFVVRRSP